VKSGALLSQVGGAAGAVKFERKLLTGGCDNQLRLWRFNDENGQWTDLRAFSGEQGEAAHADWVRDAAFAPSLGLPSNTVASCSEDKTVVLWSEDASTGVWRRSKTLRFDAKVYRVSWSLMGNILAVAQGDNKVSLWKESMDGDWKNLSQAQAQHFTQGAGAGGPLSPAAYPQPAQEVPSGGYQQPQQQQQQQQHAHQQPQAYAQQQHAPHPQQHPQQQQQQQQHQQQQYAQPQYQNYQQQQAYAQQGQYGTAL
jgi:hypothetical protein